MLLPARRHRRAGARRWSRCSRSSAASCASAATSTEIRTRDGRVTGRRAPTDGWREPFDAVASNADVVHTYERLLRDEPRARGRGPAAEAACASACRCSWSTSAAAPPPGPRPPHRALRAALPGAARRHLRARHAGRRLLALPARPDRHRPLAGPARAARRSTCCRRCRTWARRRIDWERSGPRYADRILDDLEQRYIPGLRGDLVTPPHLHAARTSSAS